MPVWFAGAGHILAGESSADDGVIMMLDSSATEFYVVETGSVAGDPNVAAGLQLGVDHETTKMLVNFKT